jgi:hypothetical protein
VQCPHHPPPSGSRAGCGHEPFSSLATGMKNGQANSTPLQPRNCWDSQL